MSESTDQNLQQDTFSIHSKTWYGEKFFHLLASIGITDYLQQGLELKTKRRILDFSVMNGRMHTKILMEGDKANVIDLTVPIFSEDEWNSVLKVLAQKSFFLAKFLVDDLTPEVDAAFLKTTGKSLIPEDLRTVVLNSTCTDSEQLKLAGAALFWKFWEKLEIDPFMIFTLRGMGKDEIIALLRKYRGGYTTQTHAETSLNTTTAKNSSPNLTAEGYWNMRAEIDNLRFSIKADELPAAILKRLDPLPLAGLEEVVEPFLETAYADVARRSQAFGLGLLRRNVAEQK